MQTNHSKSKELLLRPNKQEMSGSSYTRKKIELAKVWTTWKDLFIKFCDCWNGVFYKPFNIVILPRFYKNNIQPWEPSSEIHQPPAHTSLSPILALNFKE